MISDSRRELKVAGEVFPVQLVLDADFSDPDTLERDWVLEGNARAHIARGRLRVDSFGSDTAATLWCRAEFEADLAVEFSGMSLPPHGACNFNLFLHASELDGSDVLGRRRSGAYSEYHEINNYIFTLTLGWSRFRRDPGFNLLSEDLTVQSKPDVDYRVVVVQQGDRFRAFVNDQLVHDVTDPEPYTHGRIALRTWNTSLAYDTFRVWRLI